MPNGRNYQEIGEGVVPQVKLPELIEQEISSYLDNQDISDRMQINDLIEQEVLSYLDNQDILNRMQISENSWYHQMKEEINRRRRCVTVYTWKGETSSSLERRAQGQIVANAGHSALKTWGGGEKNRGVYASFYPGNCHTEQRIPGCRKSVPHLHTEIKEFTTLDRAVATDLYGLDIEAINQSFDALHDEDMNSHAAWNVRYNCSDVVLFLLSEGKLFDKVEPDHLGPIDIGFLSIILNTLSRPYFSFLVLIMTMGKVLALPEMRAEQEHFEKVQAAYNQAVASQNIVAKIIAPILVNAQLKLFNIYKTRLDEILLVLPKCIISMTNTFIDQRKYPNLAVRIGKILIAFMNGLMNVPVASLTTGFFSYYCTKKYKSNKIQTIVKNHAIKAGVYTVLEPIVLYSISLFFDYCNFKNASKAVGSNWRTQSISFCLLNLLKMNPVKLVMVHSSEVAELLSYLRNSSFRKFTAKDLFRIIFLVTYPFLLAGGSYLFIRYFYDTSTTPQHVLKIAEKAKIKLLNLENQPQDDTNLSQSSSLLLSNRFKTLGLVTALGLFAYKKQQNISMISNSQGIENSI